MLKFLRLKNCGIKFKNSMILGLQRMLLSLKPHKKDNNLLLQLRRKKQKNPKSEFVL
jgi:hypothetical protein